MAGKPKHGLDFYYQDVDELSDVKIRRLLKKYKSEGYSIYQVLKTLIYKEAHFLAFTDISDVTFLLHEILDLKEEKIKEIILYLIEINLFDEDSFNKGFITSLDIQKHYYFATKRRKIRITNNCILLTDQDKALIDNKPIVVNNDLINVNKDAINVNKDKQSNSNSKSNIKKDKIMIKNDLGAVDPHTYPFKINYYLKILIDHNILLGTEKWIEDFNDDLYKILKECKKDNLKKATYYTIKRIDEKGWVDTNGFEIVNKREYLERTIRNNALFNMNRNNKSYDNNDYVSKALDYLSY